MSSSAPAPIRLSEGETAPDFTLPDQNGDPVTLSQLRGGKVILYFYGEAGTPACTGQACDFRDRLEAFTAEGYRVVGVSRDEVAPIAKMAAEEHLTFPLLSDADRRVHELYGTFGEKQLYGRTVQGVIRATFVIDEAGVIERAFYNIKATGHVAMLRKRLGLTA
ncbi:thioredoxin-dependent thiol peroxidase [Homoserinibacter sp. GY 40078]|uniref:thioredoxin-dependent thiol peroxidase n=1 Tax=Homoserinibacter sp. GY 40078 TaxID=2603275 RepID=UPI0011CB63FE|nr:thioredoxin-dependent thiol peroxidase [Homoserinibacter sp. GY 40078]TXK16307.1 thioredoxin-dependent thiol peroxidase [Homoserinibacter sp. GY 40078]